MAALCLSLPGWTYSSAQIRKLSDLPPDFRQETWNSDSGLPHNVVQALAQTGDGYVWIGTELGLARFDGDQFTVFDKSNTPELKSNKVNALLADQAGNLWIGTQGGGLVRLHEGKFRVYTTEDGLATNTIHCLLQDTSGDVWIGTDSAGLNRWHGGAFSAITTSDGLPDNHIQTLAQGSDGAVWVGTHNGLSSIAARKIRNYSMADGLPNNYIRSVLETPEGDLWVGTNEGLARFADGRFTNFFTQDGLSSNSVSALALGAGDNLWIGTLGGSISRMHEGRITPYTGRESIPTKDVWSVLRDRSGAVWFGTGGAGVIRIEPPPLIRAYGTADGLANEVALAVFQDHEGTLWFGTNGGGLNRLRDGELTTLTTQNGLASDNVFSICEDRDGVLWFGTRKGLNTYRDGVLTTYTSRDGLPGTAVALFTDSNGSVWIGTRAGLARWKDKHFTTFTSQDGLSSDAIRTIFEDRSHRLWIGTAGGGLNLYANDHFTVYDTHKGLSSDVVMAIYESPDKTLWVGTDGGGLNCFRNGRFVSITSKDGLLDDSIFSILGDHSGALWMSSNKGLARVQESALKDFAAGRTKNVPVLSYGTADGMRTKECNGGFQPAGWKAADGKLWFPTMKGVVAVDPWKVAAGVSQQPVLIEKIVVNQQEQPARSGADLPVGGGSLEVHYTAVNFRAPAKLRFQYRLLGFDTEWVPAQQRRVAYYTNLPPGHYRFQVRATNEDNSWSTAQAVFPITLQPYFYQTFMFYVVCSVGAIALAGFAHRAYVQQLRERERILEQHVHQRTAELRREIAERETAQRESIRAREAAEEASRVKSEFLANMSHEIRTPMNGILGMTRLTLAATRDPKQKQYLDIIKDSADSLLTVIDDILDFSKVEAGKLELNPIDFDLRQTLEMVVKTLAFRAEQKEVELSLLVDADVPRTVHSDPLRLRQVILNLLGNALKFTDRGEVALSVHCDDLYASEATLRFVVSDTGIGIAKENLASIFDAFSQADSSTTRKYGGTGLGLAICHRLVYLMGGDIWASSEVGKGSQFQFTTRVGVPVAASAHPGMTAETVTQSHALATLSEKVRASVRILLAEDNPANRIVAKFTLEQAGFYVQAVENGSEALAAVAQSEFDLVLMDCRMPVMDGYVATEKIRLLDGRAGSTPIIALTASAFQEDRERAERAGMNDFVAKPFADIDLIQKCVFWVKQRRPFADEPTGQGEHLPSRAVTPVDNNLAPAPDLAERLRRYPVEFSREMLEVFLQSAPPVFARLGQAIDEGDIPRAREAAHWLRGGATRMAGAELQANFASLEEALRAEPPVGVRPPDLDALTRQFNAVCAAAEKWLAEYRVSEKVPVSIE